MTHKPNRQAAAVEVPAPVARFFREAGIAQETLRDWTTSTGTGSRSSGRSPPGGEHGHG